MKVKCLCKHTKHSQQLDRITKGVFFFDSITSVRLAPALAPLFVFCLGRVQVFPSAAHLGLLHRVPKQHCSVPLMVPPTAHRVSVPVSLAYGLETCLLSWQHRNWWHIYSPMFPLLRRPLLLVIPSLQPQPFVVCRHVSRPLEVAPVALCSLT